MTTKEIQSVLNEAWHEIGHAYAFVGTPGRELSAVQAINRARDSLRLACDELDNQLKMKPATAKEGVGMIKELDPELFTWELYDSAGTWLLDDALHCADSFGYCEASRLAVRPRMGDFALMIEWANGKKCWFHVSSKLLELIKKRLQRRESK